MTNFITYQCNKCLRTTDIEQNNTHAFINKCNITLNCLGKLSPVNTKQTRNILGTSNAFNLVNYGITQSQNISKNSLIDLNSAVNSINGNNGLTIAMLTTSIASAPSTISLNFEINSNSNNQNFIEYDYSLSNFNQISGKDNSSLQKILKFANTDTVVVYLNGIQLEQSRDYNLSPSGFIISLSQTVISKSNVRILVYSSSAKTYTNSIIFEQHSSTTSSSAWSNVQSILIGTQTWVLYSCNSFNLPIGTQLNIDPNTFVQYSDIIFLLANPNFTSIDRNLFNVIPFSNLLNSLSKTNFLILSLQNGDYMIQSTLSSLMGLSSIIIPSVISPSKETISSSSVISNSNNINDIPVSNIIGVF